MVVINPSLTDETQDVQATITALRPSTRDTVCTINAGYVDGDITATIDARDTTSSSVTATITITDGSTDTSDITCTIGVWTGTDTNPVPATVRARKADIIQDVLATISARRQQMQSYVCSLEVLPTYAYDVECTMRVRQGGAA